MPSCSKAKNPRGVEIIFTEEDHKYKSIINGQEVLYTSGTQFLGKYFPPFDPDGSIAARCAAKEGVSPEEIKAKWSAKGAESCRLGTRLHETIEDTILKRDFRNTPESETEKMRFANGIKVAQALLQKTDILGVEKIVFSDRLRISGTIDLLAQSRKDGSYLIIDHKTNASIEKEPKYKKFCLAPISHLLDTSFNHYALQLNLYQYLLKYEGYVPKDAKFKLFLNHVLPESTQFIQLPDLQLEIRDLVVDNLLQQLNSARSLPSETKSEQASALKCIDDL